MNEMFSQVREEVTLLESLFKELNTFQEEMMAHMKLSQKYFLETTKIVHDKTEKA